MKKMKLLFTLAIPVILIQSSQAQTVVEKTNSGTTISRLIGIADWVNDGASFYYSDSTTLSYSSNRGGDLTHLLKYDNQIKFLYFFSDSTYHNSVENQQQFDGSNNIISNQTLSWGTLTGWGPQSKALYYYDLSNKMTQQIQQSWSSASGSWAPVSQDVYTYNVGTSLLFSDVYSIWSSALGGFVFSSEKLYYYDAFGNMVQELDQAYSGTSWSPSQEIIYTYNSSNKVLTSTVDSWTGGTYVPSNRYSYTYDSVSGNMTSKLYQTYNSLTNSWVNTTLDLYSNFSGVNPQTDIYQLWNDTLSGGTWQSNKLWSFTYNTMGQMTTKTGESWNILGIPEYANGDPRANYYYQTVTDNTAVQNVENNSVNASIFPVPAQNSLHIDITVAEAQSFEISIVDMSGRIIREWNTNSATHYSTVIPTDNLSQGNYCVVVNSVSGKITKQFVVVH